MNNTLAKNSGCITRHQLMELERTAKSALTTLRDGLKLGAQVDDASYPEYFAYYWGMTDPYAGTNGLWCGNPKLPNGVAIQGCDMISKHQTVFLSHREWDPPGNYMLALNWVAEQPAIKNVFISMNFVKGAAAVAEWQKQHGKIKAIYVEDEPLWNSRPPIDRGKAITALIGDALRVRAIPAFANTPLFCTFAYASLRDEPQACAGMLSAFSSSRVPIDWVGFDQYVYSTAIGDVQKQWSEYLIYATRLKNIVGKLSHPTRMFVVPQLSGYDESNPKNDYIFGKSFSQYLPKLTSRVWNSLIINWGLQNNAVAIIPFISLLSMMQKPANVSALTAAPPSPTNYTFLEEVRSDVEMGKGLQKCGAVSGANPLSTYPLPTTACKEGDSYCSDWYQGGNAGAQSCTATTYNGSQWVSDANATCCRLKLQYPFVVCHEGGCTTSVYFVDENKGTKHSVSSCTLCGQNLCSITQPVTQEFIDSLTLGPAFDCAMWHPFVVCHEAGCADTATVYFVDSSRGTKHPVASCNMCSQNLCSIAQPVAQEFIDSLTLGAAFECSMWHH